MFLSENKPFFSRHGCQKRVTFALKRHSKKNHVLALVIGFIAMAGGATLSEGADGIAADLQVSNTGSREIVKTTAIQTSPGTITMVLDSGDRLRIRFYDRFDRDDLNGDYLIGESGTLRLPRIGTFDAKNKTTAELERNIRVAVESKGEKLGYFSIDVAERRAFYVAGFSNRPGSYGFLPNMTVIQAVALSGGLFRSLTVTKADVMREKGRLVEVQSRLKELFARKARLQAEKDNAKTVDVPHELLSLDPPMANAIIDRERETLTRLREVESRERAGMQEVISLTEAEVESYRAELETIGQMLTEQTKSFKVLQPLHERKIINQQRFSEALAAIGSIQRDKQLTVASIARTKAILEKAHRDLSMLELNKGVRLAKEFGETDLEISKLNSTVDYTRQVIANFESLTGHGENVAYKIMRRNMNGQVAIIPATEATLIMPGDVLQIESPTAPTALSMR